MKTFNRIVNAFAIVGILCGVGVVLLGGTVVGLSIIASNAVVFVGK